MVGDLYHVQLMLDHHHCTAGIGQALQYVDQPCDIRHMKPRGRFVQNIKGAARVAL